MIPAPTAQFHGAHIYARMQQNLANKLGAGVTLVGKLTFNVLNSVVVRNQEAVDKYVMQREPGLGLVSVSNHIRWGELLPLSEAIHQLLRLQSLQLCSLPSDVSTEPQGLLPAGSLPSMTSAARSAVTSV